MAGYASLLPPYELPNRCQWCFPAGDIHDHARGKVEPRLDRRNHDVFRVGGVRAKALQAEAFDHRVVGFQARERGIGAAATRLVGSPDTAKSFSE